MEFKPLYKSVFSQIRPAYDFDPEMFYYIKRRRSIHKKLILAAAVIAILAGLCVTAYAANLFGLRDLLLTSRGEQPISEYGDAISLSGYNDTPETLANAEWQAFLSSYDADGSILAQIGNGIYAESGSYLYYLVYTDEMAAKLDEIAEKYKLALHSYSLDNITEDELCAQVGGDFLGDNRAYGIYMYEDGSFAFDGEADIDGYGLLDFQFLRCVRGSLTASMLTPGDVDEYSEWTYTTSGGIPLTLAIAPHKALVIADLADSFVTINVLAGTETPEEHIFSSGAITATELERFADSFDFSLLTPARPADASLISPKPSADVSDNFYIISGMQESEAQSFYSSFTEYIANGDRQAALDMLYYPTLITVPDGKFTANSSAELLDYYDYIFTPGLLSEMENTRYDMERADLITSNGAVWFAKNTDGKIGIITVQNSDGWSIRRGGSSGRAQTTYITYMTEGFTVDVPASLYIGSGYSLYIPDEGWESPAANNWVSTANNNVSFEIRSYDAEAAAALKEQLAAEGYTASAESDWLSRYSTTIQAVRLFEGTGGIMAFYCTYPAEAAEGFGAYLPAIANTLAIDMHKYGSANAAYPSVLSNILYERMLPDGTFFDSELPMEYNHFAIYDVNCDGVEELILLMTNSYIAGQVGYVLAYSEEFGGIHIELTEFPLLTFYDNGYLTAGWSHNQGLAGDSLWPYTLYRYNSEAKAYKPIAKVDAWDKELVDVYQGQPFPDDVDRSGTGVVYYIMPSDNYDTGDPKDASEYSAWLSSHIGGELELNYMSLTTENIAKIQ